MRGANGHWVSSGRRRGTAGEGEGEGLSRGDREVSQLMLSGVWALVWSSRWWRVKDAVGDGGRIRLTVRDLPARTAGASQAGDDGERRW